MLTSKRGNGVSTEVLRRTVRAADASGDKAQRCRGRVLTVKTGSAGTEQAGSDGDEPAETVAAFDALLVQLRQEPDWEQLPFFRRLRRIRKARDWSLRQLAGRMVLAGERHKGRTARASSLKSMISRWENDEIVPDDRNRRLLADALGCRVADLGLTVDPDVIW